MTFPRVSKLDFYRDGLTVVRGLMNSGDIAELIAGCDQLSNIALDQEDDFFRGKTFFGMNRGLDPFDKNVRFTQVQKGVLQRVTYPYAEFDVFNRLRQHDGMLEVVAGLLGENVSQIVNQVNFSHPGKSKGWGWHQDYRFRKTNYPDPIHDYVQCVVALDHCSEINGGMRFILGSHSIGKLELDSGKDQIDSFVDVATAFFPVLEPGDAVLFNPLTIHGSVANRSTMQRRLFINGFARSELSEHGIKVLAGGRKVADGRGYMEYEFDPALLAKASKY